MEERCCGILRLPEDLVDTPAGVQLAKRMLVDAWTFWRWDDIGATWKDDLPITVLLNVQKNAGIKRGPGIPRVCLLCKKESSLKCGHCLATHYCSKNCQLADWKKHKSQCAQPLPKVKRHVAIAVPDFICLWQYMTWLTADRSDEQIVSVVILSRDTFVQMFGKQSLHRSFLNLAFRGRPSCELLEIFAEVAVARYPSAATDEKDMRQHPKHDDTKTSSTDWKSEQHCLP